VVLAPQVSGGPGRVTGADVEAAEELARGIALERDAFYVDQFANDDCPRAHEETTGPEIWEDTGGRLDAFVCAVGSGATLIGTARFLRGRAPQIRCGAVEPTRAAILATGKVDDPRHTLQGTGYGLVPPHWDPSLVDLYLQVDDETAQAWRLRLAHEEGLYVGSSAAANVAAAAALLGSGELGDSATVVTILCDTGLKYQG
jgi:cysteine synthase A